MYRIDLHTHSIASPDGSLKPDDYRDMLVSHELDYIAITDHDTIDFALAAQKALGDKIIVGEEITTSEGELIGLFLTQAVPAGLSARETAQRIRAQGGLVYVPHPFETVRKGVSLAALDAVADLVDIVEAHNGRAVFQNRGPQASEWAYTHSKGVAAGSDAHGRKGWGYTYTVIPVAPTRETLVAALGHIQSQMITGNVGVRGVLYPKFNRWRKRNQA